MTTRRLAVLAVAAAVAVLAACSPLPAERTPRAIDRSRVPELFPKPSTTVPTSGVDGHVCFVSQKSENDSLQLMCEVVDLEERSPSALIDALAAGPDAAQRASGLVSPFPQDTRLLGLRRTGSDDGTLVVNLSNAMNSLSSPNNIIAYRQLVETLTNQANGLDARAVQVEIDGKPTKIPTDSGQLETATPDSFRPARGTTPTSTTARRR